MTIDRVVFAVAGSFILISLLLAHYHSENVAMVHGFCWR